MISDFQPFLRRIIALALGRKSFILGGKVTVPEVRK